MERLGVAGAGTMGAGIAQVAALAGMQVRLFDVGPAALEAGLGRIRVGLDRLVQRGRLRTDEQAAALSRIRPTANLEEMAEVEFVVEAAPEALELKRTLFERLDRICVPEAVLATNTSSLSVTEIGALTRRHALVVGMHFFNPVPAMKLVEVVRGARTGESAVRTTLELARRLGKSPVLTRDTPGFIVNRVARPFPGEALRLLGEGVASTRQIDRIVRLAAGFRMGPFELMDLVGMDVNLAVNRSVFEQFFQEPRFRPSPLQSQMVKAGLLGRKSGEGWYRYAEGAVLDGPEAARFAERSAPHPASIHGVAVLGDPALAERVAAAGYERVAAAEADLVALGPDWVEAEPPEMGLPDSGLLLVEASALSVTEFAATTDRPGRVVGYGALPISAEHQLVELAAGLRTKPESLALAQGFIHSLGRDTEAIRDSPGLVAPRLIACLANEAAYALMEGVATAAGIDDAMQLGVNYPRGPLQWADEIGLRRVLRILQALQAHTGDDRYRPCPLLRQMAVGELHFRTT